MHHLGCLLPERNPIYLFTCSSHWRNNISHVPQSPACVSAWRPRKLLVVLTAKASVWARSHCCPTHATQSESCPHTSAEGLEGSGNMAGLPHVHLSAHLSRLALAAGQVRQRRQLSKPMPFKSSRIASSHRTPSPRVPMML